MLGRTPPNLTAVRPLKAGVIADFDATEHMLAYFIKKAQSGVRLGRPRLIIGVPSSLTSVERQAIGDVAHRARPSEVHLVEEPVAAAMGADLPIDSPVGTMTTMEVKGRHAVKGFPYSVTVTDGDILVALEKTITQIVQAVRETLERTPPDLSADIAEHGIVLNGGGSLLKGFDRRITRDTGLPARWTDDPLASVVLGAGRMFADFDLLRRLKPRPLRDRIQ